ncbi:ABC transporter substrate-binding protein [Erwinia sp. OLTSP20]|uniref:ABC transporter ATP-binding protein n=1 Tax=unclassified Erwinia TaxID=2622719 RepID=UPI000C179F99|nr:MULTISPECIES: ABC transporter ATP-binding protein [unclassified Erwinia]PIJ51134.1 ABC transporter substrate-binding protein [Erwinia sp. OAMSP11]PIJ73886.1 ABC transporter substrate-binding protein [Erwinia sp. OLSSP12]PIJ83894.1 ABC transporter substrate-binding protein [Erwinia sp. OLCASP19]PIJ86424.1 ABC transporter substrate-binding protein [Erwinia sp. OLMTSP26]PIJ87903.1 ABC transporter substrate-binding protein [Erwinia sp. OLMDSP33]
MTLSAGGISLHNIDYAFAGNKVLNALSLTIEPGEVVALLGPSGCGKSTLLKLLAGLLQPQCGEIFFGDRLVASAGGMLPPEQRDLGMVFQDYALWPHMTVAQNVDFPLRMRKIPSSQRQQRVQTALSRVGLANMAKRKPSDLSGGQQQRVALARAIVAGPRTLLFDEPLSNLDSTLREELCHEIAVLLRQLGATAVYVTHDRHEAGLLADRIVQLSSGQVTAIQTATLPTGKSA